MVLVYIRSRRRAVSKPGHPALTCFPNGDVVGNSFGVAEGRSQKWDLQEVKGRDDGMPCITLQSVATGQYLSASRHGTVLASTESAGETERWWIRNHRPDQPGECGLSLQNCASGRYLTNDGRFDCGKIVRADREEVVPMWSEWIIVNDRQALTRYSAGGTVRMVGAAVTTLLFPLVLGAVFITMNQRSLCYGGSEEVFQVLMVNDKAPNNSSSSSNNHDFERLLWIPLQCTSAAKNVSKASKGAAGSLARTSQSVACSISAASGRTVDNINTNRSGSFHDDPHFQEKESLLNSEEEQHYDHLEGTSNHFHDSDAKEEEQRKSLI